jgi:hypothetical protein
MGWGFLGIIPAICSFSRRGAIWARTDVLSDQPAFSLFCVAVVAGRRRGRARRRGRETREIPDIYIDDAAGRV